MHDLGTGVGEPEVFDVMTDPSFAWDQTEEIWKVHYSRALAFFIPVDNETSIIALRFCNRLTGLPVANRAILWLGSLARRIVERQDKRVVEPRRPVHSSLRGGEKQVSADRPIFEYRSRRDSLQKAGDNEKPPE